VLLFFDISRIKLDKNGGKTCFDNVKMCLFQAKIHLFCEIKKLERKENLQFLYNMCDNKYHISYIVMDETIRFSLHVS
jgi:hypothetical protein